ncbi:2452_t:CDS:1, partial [Ambispora gerdemannii]
MPKRIERRACSEDNRRCQFDPPKEVTGEITFQRQVNCSVIIVGQLNFHPDEMNLPIELTRSNYDIHLTLTGDTETPTDPSADDLEDRIILRMPPAPPTQINESFRFTLDDFKVDFNQLTNYHCVLAYDDWSRFTGIRGSED